MMTLETRGPSAAAMPSASRMAGNDIRASISRMIAPSSLRNCAAITPMTALHRPEATQTAKPTDSEIRAPYSTRVKMSRPNMSVPNQNASEGGRKRKRTRIAEGSTGEISVASDPAPVSVMTHSRISQGVKNIDDQIDHNEGEAQDQHGALHQRIVAGHDRLDHHAADPRQREHLFDDDGAADRRAEKDAGGRDDQDQGVAQRMLADGPPLAEALGARGADVVLAENIEHGRTGHAGK